MLFYDLFTFMAASAAAYASALNAREMHRDGATRLMITCIVLTVACAGTACTAAFEFGRHVGNLVH